MRRHTGDGHLGPGKEGHVRSLGAQSLPLPNPRQQALHFQFLQLVAAVEQHQQKFRSQASVIDELVDIAFEVNQEGEGQGKEKERLGR